jgi:hypothetical protein
VEGLVVIIVLVILALILGMIICSIFGLLGYLHANELKRQIEGLRDHLSRAYERITILESELGSAKAAEPDSEQPPVPAIVPKRRFRSLRARFRRRRNISGSKLKLSRRKWKLRPRQISRLWSLPLRCLRRQWHGRRFQTLPWTSLLPF